MNKIRKILFFLVSLLLSAGTFISFHNLALSQSLYLPAPSVPVPAHLFGLHIHGAANDTPKPWPTIPFSTWRLWDAQVSWPRLEPKKGEWNFVKLDRSVELAQQNQVEILLPLGLSPNWASMRPEEPSAYGEKGKGWAAEPKNMEDWRNYVRTVAERYKGKIHYYEIWNEPNVKHFYSGTIESMVALSREAYQILKSIDPSIQVISPAPTGDDSGPSWVDGTSWLEEYLLQGGGAYTDVIGYHLYVIPRIPEGIVPLIRRVQAVLARYNNNQKQLWNTETGWAKPKIFSSDEEEMGYVARSYILSWAAGVSRFYWYAWNNQNWVTLRMIDNQTGVLQPGAIAYAEVQKWLVGSTLHYCQDSKQGWSCQLTRGENDLAWIVWNPYGSVLFKVPESWNVRKVTDLNGFQHLLEEQSVTIGQAPILLE